MHRYLILCYLGLCILAPVAGAYENESDLRVQRWLKAYVPARHKPAVDKVVRRILLNQKRYKAVDAKTGVPWYVIAGLHNMESSGSFRHHLHEGSPLSRRTRWVPKGRPKTGSPPFTWEYSAYDALRYDNMGSKRWAYLFDTLWAVECYNGTGYWRYHRSTPTQYLYAKTSIERAGKYVSDGKWSSTARSKQIGVAAIWKRMQDKKVLCFKRLK
jgi:lysozyme family protein